MNLSRLPSVPSPAVECSAERHVFDYLSHRHSRLVEETEGPDSFSDESRTSTFTHLPPLQPCDRNFLSPSPPHLTQPTNLTSLLPSLTSAAQRLELRQLPNLHSHPLLLSPSIPKQPHPIRFRALKTTCTVTLLTLATQPSFPITAALSSRCQRTYDTLRTPRHQLREVIL